MIKTKWLLTNCKHDVYQTIAQQLKIKISDITNLNLYNFS